MTIEQAEREAREWNNIHDDANAEEECGCHATAERLRNEARDIEKKLEADGYDAAQLLRQIQARRRDL